MLSLLFNLLLALFPSPDTHLTPGLALKVSKEEVCTPDYSKRARKVSHQTKRKVIEAYQKIDERFGICFKGGACEIDHLISLELGGSNDRRNLWPEPYCSLFDQDCLGARQKDVVENRLHWLVCHGKMSLEEAQKRISLHWVEDYRALKKRVRPNRENLFSE